MEHLYAWFGEGLQPTQLSLLQVCLRAIVMFFSGLAVVRFADQRFFAKKTAFDALLGLMLASMMARAINGSERLVPTVAAGFLLALLHRGLGFLAVHWQAFGGWVKGHGQDLVVDGKIDEAALRRNHFAADDLEEDLRLKGVQEAKQVKLARLERSGEVSVVRE